MNNKRRLIWTTILGCLFAIFSSIYNTWAPVYETEAALGQMEHSDEADSCGRLIATWDPTYWVGALVVALVLCMWVPVLWRGIREVAQEA